MPRRTRTRLISQKKVRSTASDARPQGDVTFPEPAARVVALAWPGAVS